MNCLFVVEFFIAIFARNKKNCGFCAQRQTNLPFAIDHDAESDL